MAHIKNRLRGLLAAFVALVAALAIVPGVAQAVDWNYGQPTEGKGSIQITGIVEGSVAEEGVQVYQVATIDLDDQTNVTYLTYLGSDDLKTATETWAGEENPTAVQAENVAKNVSDDQLYSGATVQINGATIDISNLEAGIYYIKLTSTDASVAYENIIVSVEPERSATGSWIISDSPVVRPVKSTETTLTKSVLDTNNTIITDDSGNPVDNFVAVDGQTFRFRVDFVLGTDMDDFTITDDMTGLDLVNDTEGSTQGITLYKVGSPDAVVANDNVFTVNVDLDGQGFTVDFTDEWVSQNAGDYYIVYDATIADNATAGDGEVKNHVTSDNNKQGDTVTFDLAKLTVIKYEDTDEAEGYSEGDTMLADAEFAIYNANPEGQLDNDDWKAEHLVKAGVTAGEDGSFVLDKVLDADGEYWLVETKAPTGYKLNPSIFHFEFGVTDQYGSEFDKTVKVEDEKSGPGEGIDLPETGGMGTVALTAAGVVLVAGAAAFIVRSRKEN